MGMEVVVSPDHNSISPASSSENESSEDASSPLESSVQVSAAALGAHRYFYVHASPIGLHPLTVAGITDSTLTFALGSHGRLQKSISGKETVNIDGPYGVEFTKVWSNKCVILVSGGIGVTPILALLQSIAGLADRETYTINAWLVVRSLSVLEPFLEVLTALKNVTLKIFYTGEEKQTLPGLEITIGRPNLNELVGEVKAIYSKGDISLAVCGSSALGRDASGAAGKYSDANGLVHIFAETFDV